MHSAPAVRYLVVRSSRAGWVAAGIWGAGAALCLWWSLQPGVDAWSAALGLSSVLACAMLAAVQWKALPQGELLWDGAQWWWRAGLDDRPVDVRLRLDFGVAMLLHLTTLPGCAPWCLVDQRTMPTHWADMRRAIHGRAAEAQA